MARGVRCTGKGRKTRCVPLRKEAVGALRQWLRERNGQPADAVGFVKFMEQDSSKSFNE